MQVQRTKRYRCTLIPPGMPDDQVELASRAGRLPTIQFRAPHADYARSTAAAVTGKRVHEVMQLQEGGAA